MEIEQVLIDHVLEQQEQRTRVKIVVRFVSLKLVVLQRYAYLHKV